MKPTPNFTALQRATGIHYQRLQRAYDILPYDVWLEALRFARDNNCRPFYSIRELAKSRGCCRMTIFRLIQSHPELPVYKVFYKVRRSKSQRPKFLICSQHLQHFFTQVQSA